MKSTFGWRRTLQLVIVCCCLTTLAYAQLGQILKGGAVAVLVDKFGPDINKAVNAITDQHNASPELSTKVVPILSLGTGGYVGAVQVTGPESQLRKVKAVAQVEGNFKVIGGVRIRALIPVEARSLTNLRRVPNVGVSALVDIKL
ncbi:MAG TPA: hypothetical protein VKU00_20100 [Chthonomonadaceae bacterium]|nr:hypothetical protein [Chthonomonadaceae bacterium]